MGHYSAAWREALVHHPKCEFPLVAKEGGYSDGSEQRNILGKGGNTFSFGVIERRNEADLGLDWVQNKQ